jgi:hypothetical protein
MADRKIYSVTEDSVLEQDGVKVIVPAGSQIIMPEGRDREEHQHRTIWHTPEAD